jgi:hypothetical protein
MAVFAAAATALPALVAATLGIAAASAANFVSGDSLVFRAAAPAGSAPSSERAPSLNRPTAATPGHDGCSGAGAGPPGHDRAASQR